MIGPGFKRRASQILLFLSFLLILYRLFSLAAPTLEETAIEEIRRAIRNGDYPKAIEMCQVELRREPEHYDLNFLLGQAYAFSGRWDEALVLLGGLAARFPQNTDVLLFRARVESWKKNYEAAEKGYRQVLCLSPGNLEALTGLAEISSWQGNYAEAIAIYEQVASQQEESSPSSRADTLFRLGRVYLWSGNYDKARQYYRLALQLEPECREYRRALKMVTPRWPDRYEVRYEHQVESFNDGRSAYVDDRLAFQVRLDEPGPLIFKAGRTERFGQADYQVELEFYPRLWDRAYAFLNATYSSRAIHFPEYSFLAEIYQTLFRAWDVSLGYRRIGFASQSVSLYIGSLGYYFGNWIAFWRWYYTPRGEGHDFSWTASLRRYFSASSYLYAGYGQGSRPFDIVTLEDYTVDSSRVFFAGFDWLLGQKIRLQLNFTHRDEGVLTRNLLFLSAGFRW